MWHVLEHQFEGIIKKLEVEVMVWLIIFEEKR
jgi:hypothetical protein